MHKISCAGCLGLSPALWAQFTLEMCVAAQNRQKFTFIPYFKVYGHPRSLISMPLESHRTTSY